jgi:phenylalanyl-tRNA synthetase alpha chain
MSATPLDAEIAAVQAEIDEAPITTDAEAEAFRVRFLGRKSGVVTDLFGKMGTVPPETRRALGQRLNALKQEAQARLDAATAALATETASGATDLDLTLPGRVPAPVERGSLHVLTQALSDIQDIFRSLGFAIARGPEIEDDWHNFTALNFPPDHPARDMQDTFFLEPPPPDGRGVLLRTHTSPVQVRAMEAAKPPIRLIAPGRGRAGVVVERGGGRRGP